MYICSVFLEYVCRMCDFYIKGILEPLTLYEIIFIEKFMPKVIIIIKCDAQKPHQNF